MLIPISIKKIATILIFTVITLMTDVVIYAEYCVPCLKPDEDQRSCLMCVMMTISQRMLGDCAWTNILSRPETTITHELCHTSTLITPLSSAHGQNGILLFICMEFPLSFQVYGSLGILMFYELGIQICYDAFNLSKLRHIIVNHCSLTTQQIINL